MEGMPSSNFFLHGSDCLMVSAIILERMRALEMSYPARDKIRREALDAYRKELEEEA